MEVKNCKDCGRLFNYIGGVRLCTECKKKLDEKFVEVKEYIRENKGATIPMVAEACDVSQKQITQWVREERLEFSEESSVTLQCENCGAPIRRGRFCSMCRAEMTRNLQSAYAPVQAQRTSKDGAKMRFLDQ